MYKIIHGENRFYVLNEDNQEIGELTYLTRATSHLVVNHTFVNPKYRGQNIARKLVDAFVEYARSEKKKVIPICSYVQAVFSKNQNLYKDILD
ncbi:MAG TPA: N-acetyltransferase [Acholeplasmataceae bacterium]|jgi:predicted GNAT family acetyltransferase|nr:N-acetyltransferase [Acholeplasmataceae bacterium]